MKDVVYDLAAHAAKTKYDDLPKDVVEVTKKFILDTLGCAIAGSTAPGCDSVVDMVKDWGGKEESTIIAYGGRVPAPHAAFANATMAQALDLDDVHNTALLHANVGVVPAAMAMAERMGKVSGQELIAAIAVGIDVSSRLMLGVIGPLTWVFTSVGGYFGAAVAASKLLDLDENALHHALGIVYTQCAGSSQSVHDRALVKRIQNAFPSKAGIISALLAHKGITGVKDVFEGRYGLYPLYFGGKYDRDKVLEGLGKRFEGENLCVKLHVCCGYCLASVDATLAVVTKNNIRQGDVEEVVAHVTEAAYGVAGRPFEVGANPQVDAQFNIPYTVALAIAERHVFIDNMADQKIRTDTQVLELSRKVKVVGDQGSVASLGRLMAPAVVEIRTKDNKVYSERVEAMSGSPENPASMEDVANKFRKCSVFSAKPISKKTVEEIIQAVCNLESASDVGNIARMTC